MFSPELAQSVASTGIVPVVIINDPDHALPLAKALSAGGIRVAEITFRTTAAEESIRRIAAEAPDVLVGAGTLLTPDQVKRAKDAGAAFAVAPGCTEAVVKTAQDVGLPFAPGVMTPSDVERAIGMDCRILKFFPAESAGGLTHLKSLYAPYQALGIQFVPTGGINVEKAKAYLGFKGVVAVGGSWLTKSLGDPQPDWSAIESEAAAASAMMKEVRG